MFPTHNDFGKQRRFSHDWLKTNTPWLVYSNVCDGGFCLPCVMFARAIRGSQDLGALVIRPLKVFNKANEMFRKHSMNTYHKNAMINQCHFMDRMEYRHPSVYSMIQSAHAQLIQENRQKFTSILKCIIFCGKQNIALRGHRDDDKSFICGSNSGNFKALLKFRSESGDLTLKDHLERAPKNATYISKTIQNELIEVTGD